MDSGRTARDESIDILADLLERRIGPSWSEGLAREAAGRLAATGITCERMKPRID